MKKLVAGFVCKKSAPFRQRDYPFILKKQPVLLQAFDLILEHLFCVDTGAAEEILLIHQPVFQRQYDIPADIVVPAAHQSAV